MRNKKQIEDLMTVARTSMKASCAKLIENKKVNVNQGIEEVSVEIANFIRDAVAVVSGTSAELEGASLPKFLHSWSRAGVDTLDYIDFTVKSKLNVRIPVKRKVKIYASEGIENQICDTLIETILEIFAIELASENVADLVNTLGKIVAEKEFDLPFDLDFVLSDNAVESISDEAVVLGVSYDSALELADLPIFSASDDNNEEGRTYTAYLCTVAKDKFIEELKAVQTPVQLLKAGIKLFEDITSLKTKKRADSILRDVYHKRAIHLATKKPSVGYVAETVKIDDEDVEIFALVEKTDATKKVVLSPFNKKTLETVDVDVLAFA